MACKVSGGALRRACYVLEYASCQLEDRKCYFEWISMNLSSACFDKLSGATDGLLIKLPAAGACFKVCAEKYTLVYTGNSYNVPASVFFIFNSTREEKTLCNPY